MIFKDINEVIEVIKANKILPEWVKEARKYQEELEALVCGDDFVDLLLQIEHIESEKKAKARKKYARPIKDINAKILEPVSNVYSATGGGKVYTNLTETQQKELLHKLSNVRAGLSIERFLEIYWAKDLYVVDPSGLIMLEWKDENVYPTYKCIDKIRNYVANGQSIEWVLFEPKKVPLTADLFWRVVDDKRDYTIKQSGELFTEVAELSFDHTFGQVPARINSERHRLGEHERLSPIDNIVEIEKEMLRDRSILTIHKFLNGFSIPYRPALICPTCHGTRKDGDSKCTSCDGKGFLQNNDIVDEIILPIDTNSEQPSQIPSNFAGFISPDLEIWDQYINEEKRLFNVGFETMWGTRETEIKDQTAMSAILNTQPMISKLHSWSNVAEGEEAFFTEMIANFMFPTKPKDLKVSTITYGRNYIIQPPEFLLKSYQDSKTAKDGSAILDRKLTEYITSKYKNDPEALKAELIKKDLEPYVHMDIEIVAKIYGNNEAMKKGLFTDWWESLTANDLNKSKEQLETLRDVWFEQQITKIKPDPIKPELPILKPVI